MALFSTAWWAALAACNGKDSLSADDSPPSSVDDSDGCAAVVFYADVDGDSHGDDEARVEACEAPQGYVEVGGDCDDGNPEVHPGAVEICNGDDDDCDGLTDDDDVDVEGWTTWFADGDGDGYGGASSMQACSDPGKGWLIESEDCNDSNETVYPGAKEVCEDGVVQDCASTPHAALIACNGAETGQGAEDFSIELGSRQAIGFADLDGDTITDVVMGATDVNFDDGDATGAFVFSGPVSGLLDPEDAHAILSPDPYNRAGMGLTTGRWDSDGQDDLVVGAPHDDTNGTYCGAVYLMAGPVTAPSLDLSDLILTGDQTYDLIGPQVAFVGDVTGDANNDLMVTAGGRTSKHGSLTGAVYLVNGAPGKQQDISDAVIGEIHGTWSPQGFGATLGTGDTNGDGITDFAFGTRSEETVYVFHGPIDSSSTSEDADVLLDGGKSTLNFGYGLAAGDLDGDGLDDVIVGAPVSSPTETWAGSLFAWRSPLTSNATPKDAFLQIDGTKEDDRMGGGVSVTDVDEDGSADLAIQSGVHWTVGGESFISDTPQAGFLFLGPLSGSLSSADAAVTIVDPKGDRFVRIAPDVDGDGRKELVWDTEDRDTYFVNLIGY